MRAIRKIAVLVLTAGLLVSAINGFAAPKDSTWLSSEANMTSSIDKSTDGSPIGMVSIWATHDPIPDGWLECNGQTVNATKYPEYVSKFGATTPDYRGFFLRGYGGKSADLGVAQDYAVQTNGLNKLTISGMGMHDIDYLSGVTYSSTSNLDDLNSKLENYHNQIYSGNWQPGGNTGDTGENSGNSGGDIGGVSGGWVIGDIPVPQPCQPDDECIGYKISKDDVITFPIDYLISYVWNRGFYGSSVGNATAIYKPAYAFKMKPEYPINEILFSQAKRKALYDYYHQITQNCRYSLGFPQKCATALATDCYTYTYYTHIFGPFLYNIVASNYDMFNGQSDGFDPDILQSDSRVSEWISKRISEGYVLFRNMEPRVPGGAGQYVGIKVQYDPNGTYNSCIIVNGNNARKEPTAEYIRNSLLDANNENYYNLQMKIWMKEFDDFRVANGLPRSDWEATRDDPSKGQIGYLEFRALLDFGVAPVEVPYSPVTWIEYDGGGKLGLGVGSGNIGNTGGNTGNIGGNTGDIGNATPVEIPEFEGIKGPIYSGSISTTSATDTVVVKKAGENISDITLQITSDAGETRPVNKAVRYIVKVE